MGRSAGGLQLSRQIGQAEREPVGALAQFTLFRGQRRPRGHSTPGLGLLVFDRLALPPSCHRWGQCSLPGASAVGHAAGGTLRPLHAALAASPISLTAPHLMTAPVVAFKAVTPNLVVRDIEASVIGMGEFAVQDPGGHVITFAERVG